jgi:hypothetical protein
MTITARAKGISTWETWRGHHAEKQGREKPTRTLNTAQQYVKSHKLGPYVLDAKATGKLVVHPLFEKEPISIQLVYPKGDGRAPRLQWGRELNHYTVRVKGLDHTVQEALVLKFKNLTLAQLFYCQDHPEFTKLLLKKSTPADLFCGRDVMWGMGIEYGLTFERLTEEPELIRTFPELTKPETHDPTRAMENVKEFLRWWVNDRSRLRGTELAYQRELKALNDKYHRLTRSVDVLRELAGMMSELKKDRQFMFYILTLVGYGYVDWVDLRSKLTIDLHIHF